MTAGAAPEAPHAAAGATRPLLEELLADLRRELARRDEDPSGAWVEETAAELASGAKPGWYLPPSSRGGGLAFYARQGSAAFGHVHAAAEGGAPRALELARTLLHHLPSEVRSLDLGFTGLPLELERAVAAELAAEPGSTLLERRALERALRPADAGPSAHPPPGVDLTPVRSVTVEALADLDRRAFEGSVDELLIGREPEAYRRSIEALLEGRLGRFVDEASVALVEAEPPRLTGAILTGERSTRRAIFLDLMVDPERRGRGLGRFLLTWGLRALFALGYESVRLWASVRNEPAMTLYRELGFREVHGATIYRWDRPTDSPHPQTSR